MRGREPVFVDSGAWIALALSRDPLHAAAREHWRILKRWCIRTAFAFDHHFATPASASSPDSAAPETS